MKKVIFLHHSTGWNIWLGKTNRLFYKLKGKGDLEQHMSNYNKGSDEEIQIYESFFPKASPYGWHNYPFDYYNIWVRHAGPEPFMEEPTLEMLTGDYDVIMFKHCYPVSNILPDTGNPDINSDEKRLENYKLQYNALKDKLHEFPDKKFIIWTPAMNVRNLITESEALLTREFYEWIINKWHETDDNIYLWDFYKYETEGQLYLLDKYAVSVNDSHPNAEFSSRLSGLLCEFVIDVLNH